MMWILMLSEISHPHHQSHTPSLYFHILYYTIYCICVSLSISLCVCIQIYSFQWKQLHPKNIILCIIYSSIRMCFKSLMGAEEGTKSANSNHCRRDFYLFYQKMFSFYKVHSYNINTGVKFQQQDVKAFCFVFASIFYHRHLCFW